MNCPVCKIKLEKAILNNVEIDYCPNCLGMWFEEEELRWAKDDKDENLKWLDTDLWEKEHKFHVSSGQKLCPVDRLPLYEVVYGESKINVDLCNICYGVWLDRGEFKKIIAYLEETANRELLHNFAKYAVKEFLEIFAGPESLRDEIEDFVVLLKLFAHKFFAQHSLLAQLISEVPR